MRRCLQCMNEYPEEYADVCPHCGYVHGATESGDGLLRPGTILQGRYIAGTVIKNRDTDVCYIGWDALFDRKVMIQEYFPRYCASRSGKEELTIYASKEEAFKRGLELFIWQSRQLIRLYREEDVITYHACFEENKTAYAVMEYREYRTLEDYVKRKGQALGSREAYEWLRKAVQSVEKAAEIGVYHGQIGPDTFWVKENGDLVLKDFGPWRYVSGEPGIVDYGKAGERTDVYGLSRLFVWMITGKDLPQEDNLGDMLLNQFRLTGRSASAVRRGLAREIRTVSQFEQELLGPAARFYGRQQETKSSRNGTGRKGGKGPGKRIGLGRLSLPRWLIILAGGAAAVFLAVAVLVGLDVIPLTIGPAGSRLESQMVRVPNLVNLDVEEAERRLAQQGLYLSQENADFSDEVEEGKISHQEQKENTVIEQGSEIQVTVSLGKERYQLPPVRGLSSEEAVKTLEEKGFRDVTTVDSQEEGADNTVIAVMVNGEIQEETSQDEPFNLRAWLERLEQEEELVEADAKIQLIICRWETETATQMVEVPGLKDVNVEKAREVLEEAGLRANVIEEYNSLPKGTVLRQDPEAGEETAAGEYVSVWVSRGEEPIFMPDLRTKELEEAKEIIEEMGMVLADVQEKYDSSVPEGRVITQNIEPDREVSTGQRIVLEVSMGRMRETETEAVPAPTRVPATTKAATTAPPQTAAPETTAPQPVTEPVTEVPSEETTVQETTVQEPEEEREGAEEMQAPPGPAAPSGQSSPGGMPGPSPGGNTGGNGQNTVSLPERPGDVSGFEKPSID